MAISSAAAGLLCRRLIFFFASFQPASLIFFFFSAAIYATPSPLEGILFIHSHLLSPSATPIRSTASMTLLPRRRRFRCFHAEAAVSDFDGLLHCCAFIIRRRFQLFFCRRQLTAASAASLCRRLRRCARAITPQLRRRLPSYAFDSAPPILLSCRFRRPLLFAGFLSADAASADRACRRRPPPA
jgi:hypothetical protein